jgi:hypothetical protein
LQQVFHGEIPVAGGSNEDYRLVEAMAIFSNPPTRVGAFKGCFN